MLKLSTLLLMVGFPGTEGRSRFPKRRSEVARKLRTTNIRDLAAAGHSAGLSGIGRQGEPKRSGNSILLRTGGR